MSDRYPSNRHDSDYHYNRDSSRGSASRPNSGRPGGSGGRPGNDNGYPSSGGRPNNGSRPSGTGNRPSGTGARPGGNNGSGRPSGRATTRQPIKRRKKRGLLLPAIFLVGLVLILVLVVRSCNAPAAPTGAYSLVFSPGQTLIVGDAGEVTISGLPEDFAGSIRWSSSAPEVANIVDGKITARSVGETLIAAIIDGETYSNTLVVQPVPQNVSSIVLNHPNTASILSGRTLQLSAVVTLDDGTVQTLPISWSSSNVAVASVSYDGLVSARDVGTAAITAKIGNQSAVCIVSVQKSTDGQPVESNEGYEPDTLEGEDASGEGDPTQGGDDATGETAEQPAPENPTSDTSGTSVSSLSMSQPAGYLEVGGSLTLGCLVSPSSATVQWSSDNPSVATISSGGVVTGVGPGTAIITATAGGLSACCTIEVAAALAIPENPAPAE